MSKNDLKKSKKSICPNCETGTLIAFYDVWEVPVHSVLLMHSKDQALKYPKGDIRLGYCPKCSFVSNILFDSSHHEYSSDYEETQGFSNTFNSFQKQLAQYLISKYDLYQKDIIEIGCGKGDFLALLCELGNNRGIGFDPAFVEERKKINSKNQITFIKDFYSEKYSRYHGDFICCKMTLEHIYETKKFVQIIRRSINENHYTTVFFQVPNLDYILKENAFWDIYYEHCSYFNSRSLSYLFSQAGFKINNVWTDYNDQYLMLEVKPDKIVEDQFIQRLDDLIELPESISNFIKDVSESIKDWTNKIDKLTLRNKKIILWGGGSKAVAFLTTLGITDQIEFVVDINPYKFNTYLAGNGQKIVAPSFLETYKPDIVIVMNPVYEDEINQNLQEMNLFPEMIPISEKNEMTE